MKRLIPCALLLITLIVLCFLGNRRVITMCDEINGDIIKCYEAFQDDNYPLATEIASDIEKRWHSTEWRLAVFVNHSMLDNISESVSRLALYTPDDIDVHFALECANINTVLHRMCDEQRILIENFY